MLFLLQNMRLSGVFYHIWLARSVCVIELLALFFKVLMKVLVLGEVFVLLSEEEEA